MKIAMLGAGSLAIALTKVLENKNHEIVMWTKFENEKQDIENNHENTKVFPGVKVNENVKITCDIKEAIEKAEVIINVLPFIAVRGVIELIKEIYNEEQIILSATKGIDETTFITTTEIFEQELGAKYTAALSGPSFAIEIANGDNISFMLGSKHIEVLEKLKSIIETENIKIETTEDIVGIQLAGGIKNAVAIGSGMLAGMKVADSTKAAYLACAMTDMANLLVSLGGKKETTYTYAGVGDLLLTCMSSTSRNFSFGYLLGEGLSSKQAIDKMNGKTVEGYKTIRALNKYVKENNISTYTIDTLYGIVFEDKDVKLIKKV